MRTKLHVKKGDSVVVIAGKEKGKTGKITKVLPKEDRVMIEGLNFVKKHVKASEERPQGGFEDKEAPLHISNVMHVCPETKKPTRIGRKWVEAKGKERARFVRFAKVSGKEID